ncbi:DNA polymerase III subunit beta [Candidatus Uhrbacteria bacterium]|nr:DNA polymerase III subunit beta [Candidatus Uhrbacteria bacterium]
MHFACTQENLIQGLNMVSHISGKNINLPVLGNVLLKTEAGSLRMSTTNLEIAVNCLVRGKVEVEGEYSVPAKLFLDYVSLLPSGKVELILQEDGLEVRSGEQETVLKGMVASEFPLLPKLAKEKGFELKAIDMKRAISQVASAVSTSESRPELMGVACYFGGIAGQGKVAFTATDSYRLAERIMIYKGSTEEGKWIIPVRALNESARIIGSYKDEMNMPENIDFYFTENQLVITFGNVELISRLIEGSFPDYKPLIPTNFKTEAILSRSEVQKAVRAASLFARQGVFDIHFSFDPEAGTCTVQSADQGTGKTKTSIKGKIVGETNRLTLNFRYLNDGLSAMDSTEIRFRQIDHNSPALIIPEGSKEEYQYLVMPIRSN